MELKYLPVPMSEEARVWYLEWLASETDLSRLLHCLELRLWRYHVKPDWPHRRQKGKLPFPVPRIDGADRTALRSEIIRRIEAAGGQAEVGAVVVTVASGELRVAMK